MFRFWRENCIPILGLFTSVGTLLCCALPALLVTLGMGAALAGLVSNIPILITLSEHKIFVFGVAGLLISVSIIIQWTKRHDPCPIDNNLAKACHA